MKRCTRRQNGVGKFKDRRSCLRGVKKPEMAVGFHEEGFFLSSVTQQSVIAKTTGCFLPAAGYRNGTSFNNAGTNGNYWSSSLNEDNPNNAYNLNFNSDNVDWNNNNRYYGYTVRPVLPALTCSGV